MADVSKIFRKRTEYLESKQPYHFQLHTFWCCISVLTKLNENPVFTPIFSKNRENERKNGIFIQNDSFDKIREEKKR